jgi:hypothetical protein
VSDETNALLEEIMGIHFVGKSTLSKGSSPPFSFKSQENPKTLGYQDWN